MSLKILELSYPRLEKRVDEKSYYTQKLNHQTYLETSGNSLKTIC